MQEIIARIIGMRVKVCTATKYKLVACKLVCPEKRNCILQRKLQYRGRRLGHVCMHNDGQCLV